MTLLDKEKQEIQMSLNDEVNKYLSAMKNGDVTQLKPLFDLIGNHISCIAKYYLVDGSYRDDVTIETFQKVCLYINSYDESKDGYRWIRRIARNVAYNYNNYIKRTAKISDTEDIAVAESLADVDFTNDVEEKIDILRAIDILEPESRELIYLHFFLRKTFKEIGAELHLSKAAVKKRIDKILLKLKIIIDIGNS